MNGRLERGEVARQIAQIACQKAAVVKAERMFVLQDGHGLTLHGETGQVKDLYILISLMLALGVGTGFTLALVNSLQNPGTAYASDTVWVDGQLAVAADTVGALGQQAEGLGNTQIHKSRQNTTIFDGRRINQLGYEKTHLRVLHENNPPPVKFSPNEIVEVTLPTDNQAVDIKFPARVSLPGAGIKPFSNSDVYLEWFDKTTGKWVKGWMGPENLQKIVSGMSVKFWITNEKILIQGTIKGARFDPKTGQLIVAIDWKENIKNKKTGKTTTIPRSGELGYEHIEFPSPTKTTSVSVSTPTPTLSRPAASPTPMPTPKPTHVSVETVKTPIQEWPAQLKTLYGQLKEYNPSLPEETFIAYVNYFLTSPDSVIIFNKTPEGTAELLDIIDSFEARKVENFSDDNIIRQALKQGLIKAVDAFPSPKPREVKQALIKLAQKYDIEFSDSNLTQPMSEVLVKRCPRLSKIIAAADFLATFKELFFPSS